MQIRIDKWRVLLLVLVTFFFCLFSLLGLWRHWGYMTSINDLGSFDQVAWMASRGHSLVNTSVLGTPMNWLGFHFQPILFAFVLLYKITPSVNWFVFAQAGALALSAWPIYLIAEQVTDSGKAAFIWSMAYLCNPFLLNAAAWDFHPVTIAVPFMALGLLAVVRKQVGLLVVASIILLACKEHMGLAVAGLGLLYGIQNRAWTTGLSLFLAGIAAFVLIVAVVMPSYSLTGQHLMFGENIGQLGRYSWLGGSPAEVIERAVLEPMHIIRGIVTLGGIDYIFLLLVPFVFLSLGGVVWLLPAAADLLANLLAAHILPRSLFSYHSVPLIPILAVAAIHGSCRLVRAVKNIDSIKPSYYVLIISLILGYGFAPLPLYRSANFWRANHFITTSDQEVSTIRGIISSGSVSAQANIGAHFSQREFIYYYPNNVNEADYVILRLESPTQRLLPYEMGITGTLFHHLITEPADYLDSVRDLLDDKQFDIVFWKDPWLVLQRGEATMENVPQVLGKIETLREEWLEPTPQ